jgi:hypothetical protein
VSQNNIRVLHGLYGSAGQPGVLAKALNKIEGISARSLLIGESKYKYGTDLVYPIPRVGYEFFDMANLLRSTINSFDIFHFHFRSFFHSPENLQFPVISDLLLLKAAGKKVCFHFRGTEARIQSLFKEKSNTFS